VARAGVEVDGRSIAEIGPGLLVLLGVCHGDDEARADRLAERVLALRVFADERGRMSEPLGDRELLCVSQFTLYADTARGNRPGFTDAAPPALAEPLYERFCERTGAARGAFGAHMVVSMRGDGPVTIMLDEPRGGRGR
jgi:D-tyrosyl-tRNA(Tyr) deacylase